MDHLYEQLTMELANPVEVIKHEVECDNEDETSTQFFEIGDNEIKEHLPTLEVRTTNDIQNSFSVNSQCKTVTASPVAHPNVSSTVTNSSISRVKVVPFTLKYKKLSDTNRDIEARRSTKQLKPPDQLKRLKRLAELKQLKALAAKYGLEPVKSQQSRKTASPKVTLLEKKNFSKPKNTATNERIQVRPLSSPSNKTSLPVPTQERMSGVSNNKPANVNQNNVTPAAENSRTDLDYGLVPTQERMSGVSNNKPANVNQNNVTPAVENSRTDLDYGLDSNLDHNLLILESLQTLEDQNKLIIAQNNEIMKQNTQILEVAKGDANVDTKLQNTLYQPLTGFPLQTVEEFNEFCQAKTEVIQTVYVHLLNLGGSKLREFLNNALKNLMTDELVSRFSWAGNNDQQKFGDTKLANLLYVTAQKCPGFRGPNTKAEFKSDMLEVLRTTKQRYRNSLKKNDEELIAKIASLEQMQQECEEQITIIEDDDSSDAADIDF